MSLSKVKSQDILTKIVLLVVKGWNRQHNGQTIHATEKFTSMNLQVEPNKRTKRKK